MRRARKWRAVPLEAQLVSLLEVQAVALVQVERRPLQLVRQVVRRVQWDLALLVQQAQALQQARRALQVPAQHRAQRLKRLIQRLHTRRQRRAKRQLTREGLQCRRLRSIEAGQLRVVVVRARGVAAVDKGGTSDPYTR